MINSKTVFYYAVLLFYVLFLAGTTPCRADDLDRDKKALDIISDFADKFCKEVPLKGSSNSLELSGDVKALLNGVLKKLANLGFESATKYQSAKYVGLLQSDLTSALKDNNKCRDQVWNDLRDRLLSKSGQTPPNDKKSKKKPVPTTMKEEAFITSLIINEVIHLTAMVLPQLPSTKLNQRLAKWTMLGRPVLDGEILSFEIPKDSIETSTYGCELVQYQIIASIRDMQIGKVWGKVTVGSRTEVGIKQQVRTSDMEKISGAEVMKLMAMNRFASAEKFIWGLDQWGYLLLPSKTQMKLTHELKPEQCGIILQKPSSFTIRILVEPSLIVGLDSIAEPIEMPPDVAQKCRRYIFAVTMKSAFENNSDDNWKTEEYKAWSAWLFSQLKESLADKSD
ncbi:MAG: hypothetical protein AABZ15_08230 [Nitrospirota bacterium]